MICHGREVYIIVTSLINYVVVRSAEIDYL